ncbi:hypothetical protein IWW57_005967, partial [Coemansia sp. S610]
MASSDKESSAGSAPYPAEPPSSYTLHKDPAPPRSPASLTTLRLATSPYPALFLSALNLASLPSARKSTRGYPSVMQCNTYTAMFALSAYALGTGDSNNGSGLAA